MAYGIMATKFTTNEFATLAGLNDNLPLPTIKTGDSAISDVESRNNIGGSWKEELTWAFRSTRVVTPAGMRPATVLVRSGRIVKVADWDEIPEAATLRDYGDHVLLPGLVDTHVHINDAEPELPATGAENPVSLLHPPNTQSSIESDIDSSIDSNSPDSTRPPSRKAWEGFRSATHAAAAGGVTTLVDMPLNCVPETIDVPALNLKRLAATESWVDWMSWGGIVGNAQSAGNESSLPDLIEAGVPGFKCFLIDSGIDTFAWSDESQIRKAIAILRGDRFRSLDLPLLAHAELDQSVEQATADLNRAEGCDWRSYRTYLASRPDEAEVAAIELLIRLAVEFDQAIHIVHISSAQALPAIRNAKAAGVRITVETCPHYLWFCSEEIPDGGTEYKCAPPIRDSANRELLWQALLDGTIDMIATDHSPCLPGMKLKDSGLFNQAWGGIASLGLTLPVLWRALGSFTTLSDSEAFESMARWLASSPARLAGVSGTKGALAPGYDADLVVFEPAPLWTVTEDDLRFRHKLSPYVGSELQGRILETYLRGECIFWGRAAGGILDPQPHGQEIKRQVEVVR